MKELKFKFWLGHTKKMTYAHTIDEVCKIIPEFTKDIITRQFTGLTDNNGTESKEVYGGDILYNADRDEYQEVIYNESEARWDVRYSHGEQRSLADAIGNLNIVAGNIHLNPELLKS